MIRLIGSRELLFDAEGFLWHAEDWSEETAKILARESGLPELTEPHWTVIRFFREYYAYHGRAPLNRDLKSGLGMSLLSVEKLFPGGIKHGARRIAGLPNPKSCV